MKQDYGDMTMSFEEFSKRMKKLKGKDFDLLKTTEKDITTVFNMKFKEEKEKLKRSNKRNGK